MISTLLPIASIALKLGSYLLSSNAKAQPEPEPVQEERLPPTVQSLFQRLGVKDADSVTVHREDVDNNSSGSG